MKIIKYKLIVIACILFLAACEKDYDSFITKVTYYPEVEMLGEPLVFVPTEGSYVDPGVIATENDEEIEVIVTSDIDYSTPGNYSIDYTAENSDGYTKTVSRQIIVYDSNVSSEDISGTYVGDVVRNGGEAYSGFPVTLTKVPDIDGVYEISDWIAGFYSNGRDYGPAFKFTGYIQINSSNEVIELSMTNPWNDPFTDVAGSYDSETGLLSYIANWNPSGTNYAFVVDIFKN
jgi:hypothetical protein